MAQAAWPLAERAAAAQRLAACRLSDGHLSDGRRRWRGGCSLRGAAVTWQQPPSHAVLQSLRSLTAAAFLPAALLRSHSGRRSVDSGSSRASVTWLQHRRAGEEHVEQGAFSRARRWFGSRSHALGEAPLVAKPTRRDPGDWAYSPEWWGTQGNSWGHGPGDTVFLQQSPVANGEVAVTAHPSSKQEADLRQSSGKVLDPATSEVLGHEWRVLRFNHVTRQSVARVTCIGVERRGSRELILRQQPDCLAFEYLKTMIVAGLATASLSGLDVIRPRSRESAGPPVRILCIGLGGGSLPLFLAHHLQASIVDCVDIDPVVISAATEAMGFPRWSVQSSSHSHTDVEGSQSNDSIAEASSASDKAERAIWGGLYGRLNLHLADGASWVKRLVEEEHWGWGAQGSAENGVASMGTDAGLANDTTMQLLAAGRKEGGGEAECSTAAAAESGSGLSQEFCGQGYDLVFVDAYDGDDLVPFELWDRNGQFLRHLSRILHPTHGTVVVNLHGDGPPPSLLERLTGNYGPGFDASSKKGLAVLQTARAYRDALVSQPPVRTANIHRAGASASATSNTFASSGLTFTVATPRQGNVALVVSRGELLPQDNSVEGGRTHLPSDTRRKGAPEPEAQGIGQRGRGQAAEKEPQNDTRSSLGLALQQAATKLQLALDFPFAAGPRAVHGLTLFRD